MKQIIQLCVALLFLSFISGCNSDAAPDCFKTAGKTISYEVAVDSFTAIEVSEGVEVVLKQGTERNVVVQTGENLTGSTSVTVRDNTLYITNNSSCNWVRDYNTTTVYVTTPVLEKIYTLSQFMVRSDGVLAFPSLILQSGMRGKTPSGIFELTVNCENLFIEDNQKLYCAIKGNATNLTVNYFSGDARFDGANLIAQNVTVFHRSSNNITINPQQEIRGTVSSTGNLILKNHPPIVEVERLYTGKIIFE